MSKYLTGAAIVCALLIGAHGAQAQSLFDAKPAGGAAPAAAPEAAAAPKPKPKRKAGPSPARVITITNVSGSALTSLEVAADGKSAKLGRELGTDETATMRLPAFKSCTVTVIASFDRAGEAEQMEQNICKDRRLRLTNG